MSWPRVSGYLFIDEVQVVYLELLSQGYRVSIGNGGGIRHGCLLDFLMRIAIP